eukprot:CAMPEP_0119543620 /NCGR_PEP_ID=MMETSP1344-20130328/54230_1 /TAXON_ID=236787 /ORGANISM="Florenciella parvula, Strain CCMP2471" /LENGTH=50 /DNA_ID=CAMNT_0007587945 /DNA_START=140 /DNA_END=289 /DNA_ORIENTATION=+
MSCLQQQQQGPSRPYSAGQLTVMSVKASDLSSDLKMVEKCFSRNTTPTEA